VSVGSTCRKIVVFWRFTLIYIDLQSSNKEDGVWKGGSPKKGNVNRQLTGVSDLNTATPWNTPCYADPNHAVGVHPKGKQLWRWCTDRKATLLLKWLVRQHHTHASNKFTRSDTGWHTRNAHSCWHSVHAGAET
jgi:hypothetical protein